MELKFVEFNKYPTMLRYCSDATDDSTSRSLLDHTADNMLCDINELNSYLFRVQIYITTLELYLSSLPGSHPDQ